MAQYYSELETPLSNVKDFYVFPSNAAGFHASKYARVAHFEYGAKLGKARGPFWSKTTANSYGITTKNRDLKPLPLSEIKANVDKLEEFLDKHKDRKWFVVNIEEYTEYDTESVAKLFKELASKHDHLYLPENYRKYTA